MIRGLLLSIGIVLISLSMLSITSPISNVVSVSKPYCLTIPPTVKAIAVIYENSTNVRVYAKISHDNLTEIVRPPFNTVLTKGKWIFEVCNETYPKIFYKTVNKTLVEKNGTVVIIQKTINYTKVVTTNNAAYPFYVKLYIKCMKIFEYKDIAEIVGAVLIISSVFLYLRKRF
ncbi:hypothetical protein [Acidianus sp. HS-5]|uniref:hypothetical protein n=1 Tax=Acidianus sp. HS-5 TaxID=2886040 RepID=UPI001F307C44|nr:hypothetical protein [Acidianus sp. HS-5]BDC17954.1 hypothetical protein HS5_08440 [Acidianus sp. HS-5]